MHVIKALATIALMAGFAMAGPAVVDIPLNAIADNIDQAGGRE